MSEILFLLVLMAITALGVRVLLGQLHGRPLRLPALRMRLPRVALPSVPRLRRPRRGRRRTRREEYLPGADDDLAFAPARSPFIPPVTVSSPSGYPEVADAYADEDGYDADAYLPANQVDFFASDEEESIARPGGSSHAPPPAGHYGRPSAESSIDEGGAAVAEASQIHEVVAEPDPDPNDIMSFFERPAAVTELPETLREDISSVSAAQLVAEAREVRALLRRDLA